MPLIQTSVWIISYQFREWIWREDPLAHDHWEKSELKNRMIIDADPVDFILSRSRLFRDMVTRPKSERSKEPVTEIITVYSLVQVPAAGMQQEEIYFFNDFIR